MRVKMSPILWVKRGWGFENMTQGLQSSVIVSGLLRPISSKLEMEHSITPQSDMVGRRGMIETVLHNAGNNSKLIKEIENSNIT